MTNQWYFSQLTDLAMMQVFSVMAIELGHSQSSRVLGCLPLLERIANWLTADEYQFDDAPLNSTRFLVYCMPSHLMGVQQSRGFKPGKGEENWAYTKSFGSGTGKFGDLLHRQHCLFGTCTAACISIACPHECSAPSLFITLLKVMQPSRWQKDGVFGAAAGNPTAKSRAECQHDDIEQGIARAARLLGLSFRSSKMKHLVQHNEASKLPFGKARKRRKAGDFAAAWVGRVVKKKHDPQWILKHTLQIFMVCPVPCPVLLSYCACVCAACFVILIICIWCSQDAMAPLGQPSVVSRDVLLKHAHVARSMSQLVIGSQSLLDSMCHLFEGDLPVERAGRDVFDNMCIHLDALQQKQIGDEHSRAAGTEAITEFFAILSCNPKCIRMMMRTGANGATTLVSELVTYCSRGGNNARIRLEQGEEDAQKPFQPDALVALSALCWWTSYFKSKLDEHQAAGIDAKDAYTFSHYRSLQRFLFPASQSTPSSMKWLVKLLKVPGCRMQAAVSGNRSSTDALSTQFFTFVSLLYRFNLELSAGR
jgi:hypothetical protein